MAREKSTLKLVTRHFYVLASLSEPLEPTPTPPSSVLWENISGMNEPMNEWMNKRQSGLHPLYRNPRVLGPLVISQFEGNVPVRTSATNERRGCSCMAFGIFYFFSPFPHPHYGFILLTSTHLFIYFLFFHLFIFFFYYSLNFLPYFSSHPE